MQQHSKETTSENKSIIFAMRQDRKVSYYSICSSDSDFLDLRAFVSLCLVMVPWAGASLKETLVLQSVGALSCVKLHHRSLHRG